MNAGKYLGKKYTDVLLVRLQIGTVIVKSRLDIRNELPYDPVSHCSELITCNQNQHTQRHSRICVYSSASHHRYIGERSQMPIN